MSGSTLVRMTETSMRQVLESVGDPGRRVRSQLNQGAPRTNNLKSPIDASNVFDRVTNKQMSEQLATMLAALQRARQVYAFNPHSCTNEALRLIAGVVNTLNNLMPRGWRRNCNDSIGNNKTGDALENAGRFSTLKELICLHE
jgi:hypothetical protein